VSFITLIGSAAAACPLGVRAQQPAMQVVGNVAETPIFLPNRAAFLNGLAEAGYVNGKNVVVEHYGANFNQELLLQTVI
jgi:putative tryptophan/tyrosine transport system substrate-binding protein